MDHLWFIYTMDKHHLTIEEHLYLGIHLFAPIDICELLLSWD